MYYNDYAELNCDVYESKIMDDFNSYDSGYSKKYKMITMPNKKNKNVKIEYYTSGGCGTYIRNAETGDYYKYKVGSKNEDLFFKVTIVDGTCNSKNGCRSVFYEDPSQYEEHQYVDLDDTTKQIWYEKRNNFLYEKEKEKDLSKATRRSQNIY